MKKLSVLAIVLVLMAFAAPAGVKADFKLGVTAGNQGLNGFYLSVGNYNRIPEREVVVVKQQGISDEELPVVFFLAAKAKVPYGEIVKLRLKRWGWMKIAQKYKLDPAIFYVPVNGEVKGRVYGRSYGYYKGRPQPQWKKIKLSDEDIVNFVNLRFVSEHYGYAPEEVIKMREQGRNFVTIDNDIRVMKTKNAKPVKEKRGHGKNGR